MSRDLRIERSITNDFCVVEHFPDRVEHIADYTSLEQAREHLARLRGDDPQPSHRLLKAYELERHNVKENLLRRIEEVVQTADSVRKDVESDGKYFWWASHTQGLVYAAAQVERELNQLMAWDRALQLLRAVGE